MVLAVGWFNHNRDQVLLSIPTALAATLSILLGIRSIRASKRETKRAKEQADAALASSSVAVAAASAAQEQVEAARDQVEAIERQARAIETQGREAMRPILVGIVPRQAWIYGSTVAKSQPADFQSEAPYANKWRMDNISLWVGMGLQNIGPGAAVIREAVLSTGGSELPARIDRDLIASGGSASLSFFEPSFTREGRQIQLGLLHKSIQISIRYSDIRDSQVYETRMSVDVDRENATFDVKDLRVLEYDCNGAPIGGNPLP